MRSGACAWTTWSSRGPSPWTGEVEHNLRIVGGDECVVVDPAHDPQAVVEAVAGRTVTAVLLTHGHDDHIRSVKEVAGQVGAPIHLHPADTMLWEQIYPATPFDAEIADRFDAEIADGEEFTVGGVTLTVLHTPGHSPGSVCFSAPGLGEHGCCSPGTPSSPAGRGSAPQTCG